MLEDCFGGDRSEEPLPCVAKASILRVLFIAPNAKMWFYTVINTTEDSLLRFKGLRHAIEAYLSKMLSIGGDRCQFLPWRHISH